MSNTPGDMTDFEKARGNALMAAADVYSAIRTREAANAAGLEARATMNETISPLEYADARLRFDAATEAYKAAVNRLSKLEARYKTWFVEAYNADPTALLPDVPLLGEEPKHPEPERDESEPEPEGAVA